MLRTTLYRGLAVAWHSLAVDEHTPLVAERGSLVAGRGREVSLHPPMLGSRPSELVFYWIYQKIALTLGVFPQNLPT